MKPVRNLLLPLACIAVLSATAQQLREQRTTRTINILEDDGRTTVTIVTDENGTTNSTTLTGTEAETWLAEHRATEAPLLAQVAPAGEEDMVGPVFCRMVVQPDCGQGAPKAEVFRYRYKPRTAPTPVHTTTTGEEELAGEGDGSDKSATAAMDDDDMRVLPNPSEGLFTLAFILPEEGANGTLYVTDAAGRVVHNEVVMGNGGQARTVDLRGKEKGTYIATVMVGDRTLSKRLVIE